MAIEKMKFVSACTDQDHLQQMLMTASETKCLHPVPALKLVNDRNQGRLIPYDDTYTAFAQTFENIAHSLNYKIKRVDSPKDYTNEEIEAFIREINAKFGVNNDSADVILTPDDAEALAKLSVCGFDRIHACQYLNFGFGRMPIESFKKLAMYRDEVFVHHKLYENKQYIWMVYVTSDSYAARVADIFQGLFFEPIEIPMIDVEKELAVYGSKIDEVFSYCKKQQQLCDMYQYLAILDEKHILSGFVKEADLDKYEKAFASLPVDFRVKNPEDVPDLECPTLLKNCWFARPFELFVSMYSLPKYGEFDPTFFLSITYCLLFGIMFGDMGQGLVLLILGLLLEKKGALFGIIGRCGITSTIFGFLFGSFFGYESFLNPIHQKLFGVKDKLFDVMANSNTMTLLLGAVAIGAVLIVITQAINITMNIRKKKWGDVLFAPNGIAGLVFYASIMFALAATMLGSSVLNPVYIVVCFVLPVVCFIMKDPLSNAVEGRTVKPREGWGGYITQSIFEMIETLLSYVTNTMSYLRVGGFVLSHAGMMIVVMTLVKMTGGAGPVVLILGNAFVMLLEGLIVGIQSLRLEYYEMFSRYYEGGGVPYKALAENN
jgi:V/A-type H+-transporting ATPase subunit I